MANYKEQFSVLLADIELEAYQRGWRDAIAAIAKKAEELMNPTTPAADKAAFIEPSAVRKPRGRPAKAPAIVKELILGHSGLTGAEIVRLLVSQGSTVGERTIRTALHRLKKAEAIEKRGDKWFPAKRPGSAGHSASAQPDLLRRETHAAA